MAVETWIRGVVIAVIICCSHALTAAQKAWPTTAPPVPAEHGTQAWYDYHGVQFPPSAIEASRYIDAYCAWEWPERALASMKQRCIEQQKASLSAMAGRHIDAAIRNSCASAWLRSFTMRDHCERTTIPAPRPAVASASAPSASGTSSPSTDAVKRKCASEWSDDFRMQKYCIDQQLESAATLGRRSMLTTDERTIRTKCATEWPDDYRMRNYCEEQQLKALASIR